MTCSCVGIERGTYANQETRLLPFATPRYPVAGTKPVGIDRCLLPDVEALWAAGIETIESCCGHGSGNGYIAVDGAHDAEMRARGYRRHPEQPDRAGMFAWPKAEPTSRKIVPLHGREGA